MRSWDKNAALEHTDIGGSAMAKFSFPPVPRSHSLEPERLEAFANIWGMPTPKSPKQARTFERHRALSIALDAPIIEERSSSFFTPTIRYRDLSALPLELRPNERMSQDEALFWLALLKEPAYCWPSAHSEDRLTQRDIDALTNATSIDRKLKHPAEKLRHPRVFLHILAQLYPDIPDLLDYILFERRALGVQVGSKTRIKGEHFLALLEVLGHIPEEDRETLSTFFRDHVNTHATSDLLMRARIAWLLPVQDEVRHVLDATINQKLRPDATQHAMLPFKLEDKDEALSYLLAMKKNLQIMPDIVPAFFARFGYEHADVLFKSFIFASSKEQQERLEDALKVRSREVVLEAMQRYESRAARNLFHKYIVEDADETSIRTLLELCDRRGKLQIRALTLLREIIALDLTKVSLIREVLPEYPQKVQDLLAGDLESDDVPPLLPFRWSEWHHEIAEFKIPSSIWNESQLDFDALPELLTADKQFGFIRALQKGVCAIAWWAFAHENEQRHVAKPLDDTTCAATRERARQLIELGAMAKELDLESLQRFLLELLNTIGFEQHFGREQVGYRLLGHICDRRAIPDLITATQHPQKRDDERRYAIEALLTVGTGEALRQVKKLTTDAYTSELRTFAVRSLERYRAEHNLDHQTLRILEIPDHGFDRFGKRLFDYGSREIELKLINLDNLVITDLSSEKTYVHPPAPLATDDLEKAVEAQRELKHVLAGFGETSRRLTGTLEELMVRGSEFDLTQWRERFQAHALLDLIARRLLWSIRDVDTDEITVVLPSDDQGFMMFDYESWEPDANTSYRIHLTHTGELTDKQRKDWGQRLGEFEITQPTPQLDRAFYPVNPQSVARLDALVGAHCSAKTLIAQTDRGWRLQASEDPRRIDRLTLVTDQRGHISVDFGGGTYRPEVGRPRVGEEVTWPFLSLTIDVLDDPAQQGVQEQQRSHPDRIDPFHVQMDMKRVDPILFSEAICLLERSLAPG